MSKQSEAKEQQNYRLKPNCCSNCEYYKCDIVGRKYQALDQLYTWNVEKNKHCLLGDFVTKKSAVCDMHKLKIEG